MLISMWPTLSHRALSSTLHLHHGSMTFSDQQLMNFYYRSRSLKTLPKPTTCSHHFSRIVGFQLIKLRFSLLPAHGYMVIVIVDIPVGVPLNQIYTVFRSSFHLSFQFAECMMGAIFLKHSYSPHSNASLIKNAYTGSCTSCIEHNRMSLFLMPPLRRASQSLAQLVIYWKNWW